MVAEGLRLAGWGALLALGLMGGLWFVHLKRRDAGVVDPGWAAALALLALLDALLGSGVPERRLFVALLGGGWGLRLALHLIARMRGKPEEGRYRALRHAWEARGYDVPRRFLGFFLVQGLLCVFLSLPFLLAALDPAPAFSPFAWAGIALWLVAVAGESLADGQLARFKADPAHRGEVCDVGLWRLSRHPNYFFEWLVWCAFALFALDAPGGPLALACPALILFFLLRVTGIPATEEQASRTKGEAYRAYQTRTSPFVPWFPRRSAE